MPTSTTPDDRIALRAAIDYFYDALQSMDLDAMSQLWAQRDQDLCIHPGWEPMRGWPLIRESWRAIFANTGFMRFVATDVDVEIVGDAARVNNIEHIMAVAGTHTTHSQVAATKIFLRTTTGWKLILHHGSAVAIHHSTTEVDRDAPAN